MTTDVDYIDPQLSYYGETWKLEAPRRASS
jgi:hypothetical protein